MGPVRRARHYLAIPVAAAILLVAMLAGVVIGAVALPVDAVLATLVDRLGWSVGTPLTGTNATLLTDLRVPRVVLAAMVGGMLALAGASYQGVFRNPLADPYLLGAAAGAGVGATLVIATDPLGLDGPLHLPGAAFLGALAGVGMSYALGTVAARHGGGAATLLLAGVAVSAFLTAVQTAIQQARADTLQQVYSWILGQLGTAGWSEVRLVLPYMAVSTVVMLAAGRALDVLAVGDEEARTLGMRPGTVRFVVLCAASLGTAAAVAVSGLIGFVGLVIPHIVRRLAGYSYRLVLPVSLLAGGAFLVLADLLARTLLAPAELPIGVITAFVGAPFFAALLRFGGSST
ncbi:FecCD family ABC transporter permease [Millisia brevis]|uniref:FecCD family ABC transporter permease n=1 Tax=Millisia brevis TaxID=264148 RepID=UPI0008349089|nr:iron ABC transporter permease [Millisia brevis]